MPIIIDVKVFPSSGYNKWIIGNYGKLKCYLKNPPEKGLANKELIKLLSKALSIVKSDIEIISGAKSRNKRLKISIDLTFDQILGLLGIEKQQSLFD